MFFLRHLLSENIICCLEICYQIWYSGGPRKIAAKRTGVPENFSDEMEGLWNIFIINNYIFWPPTPH